MKAIGKYIVITDVEDKTKETKGGLLLSSKQREDIRYRRAEVIQAGTDVLILKKDDEIYYDRSSGFNIEINKEQYKVIKELDVVIKL